jgi:hypothetical protein
MSNTGKYSLLFTGLKDEDPTTLRRVKTAFVSDLELPIPEIQEILENPPRSILSADQKNDLKAVLKTLKNAGALVEVVENGISDNPHSDPKEEDDGFSFEIDLSELAGTKKAKNTKVWELSFDQDDEDESSLADLLPKRAPALPPIATSNESSDAILNERVSAAPINNDVAPPQRVSTPAPEEISAKIHKVAPETETGGELEDDGFSFVTADADPVRSSPTSSPPPETTDPLDLILLSLDDDQEEPSPSVSRSNPNYDLQIHEDHEANAFEDAPPTEDELDLLLIDINDVQDEVPSGPPPVATALTTDVQTPDSDTLTSQAFAHEDDLAFDDLQSSQLPKSSTVLAASASESAVLTNFAKSIDDLIPHLESQKNNIAITEQEPREASEDDSPFSLGYSNVPPAGDIDTAATFSANPEQGIRKSEPRKASPEEKNTKRKSTPSFISTNNPNKASPAETRGFTLKNEPPVDDDGDEEPTVAYLNTQLKLARQAEERKAMLFDSLLYGILGLAVIIGGNWIFFSFVLNNGEESGTMIPPVTDADIKKFMIEEIKDPAAPLNPDLAIIKETVSKEVILQSKNPTFSLKATCGASEQGLVNCKVSGEGVESEMPSKKDRANGIKQPPWLTRLESDEIIFNLMKKDASRIAEGTANAYIMFDRLSSRISVNVTLRTSPPPPENTLKKETQKLTVEIQFQKDLPASEGIEVAITGNNQFAMAAKAIFNF